MTNKQILLECIRLLPVAIPLCILLYIGAAALLLIIGG